MNSTSQLAMNRGDNRIDKHSTAANVNRINENEEVKSRLDSAEIVVVEREEDKEDGVDDKNKNVKEEKRSLIEQSLNSISSFYMKKKREINDDSDNLRVLTAAITAQSSSAVSSSLNNKNNTNNELNNNNRYYSNDSELRKLKRSDNGAKQGTSNLEVHHHHHHHYYNHYYGGGGGQQQRSHNPYRSQPQYNQNYLEFKLSEIINPNRNKTFSDNLYAQLQENTNRINLFYLPDGSSNTRPSGSFPLNQKLTDYYKMQQNNQSNNTSNSAQFTPSQQDTSDYVNANRVLNEFYLNAGIKSNYYNETVTMPRMMSSELFLITFVLTLWLLSVLICLKRYSLFICFHKRDVPFYDASLINVKLNLDESPSATNNVNNSPSLAMNRSDSAITAANYKRMNSSRSHLQSSNIPPMLPGSPFATSSCVCDTSDEKTTALSSGGTIVNNGLICQKCNLMKQSMSTNLYFFNQPVKAIKSISNGNFCKPYATLGGGTGGTGGSTIGYSTNNKLAKNRYNLDFSNDYIFNNGAGVNYTNHSNTSSSLMSRATAGVGRIMSKQASRISNLAYGGNQTRNSKSSVVSIQKANVPPYSTTTTTTTTHFMTSQQMMLARKRALIRNKHFNLMSLDENALNLYRDHHRMLATNNQLTIPENNLLHTNRNESGGSGTGGTTPSSETTTQRKNSQKAASSSRNSSPKQSHKNTVNTISPPKLSNIARLTTNMPHANFISLRSGSDSMHSHGGLLRPGASCDENNSDFVDDSSFASLSQHRSSSQYLQLPNLSSSNLPSSISQQSFDLRQAAVAYDQAAALNRTPPSTYDEYVPVTTSQRPINPMSSLRRHMFATSRRNAHTTVDHSNRMQGGPGMLNYTQDSLNEEDDYQFSASTQAYSFGEFVPMNTIYSSHSQSVDTNSIAYETPAPPQMMTSFIETIDECHNDEDPAPKIEQNEEINNEETCRIADTSINVSNYDTEYNPEPFVANEVNNPNLLDPTCIPLIVRRTLLEMHTRATMSKSESNIKFRSSNHLLHAPNKPKKENKKKKKPLSLQNSQDKTAYHSVQSTTPKAPASQQQSGNYLNIVYDELKSKFFRNNSIDNKSNSSATSSNRAYQQSGQLFVNQASTPSVGGSSILTTNYNSVNIMGHNSKNLNRSNPTIMTIVTNNTPIRHHSQPPAPISPTQKIILADETTQTSLVEPIKSTGMSSSRASGLDMLAATSMSSESDVTVILNVKAMDKLPHTTIEENMTQKRPSISLIISDEPQNQSRESTDYEPS